MISKFSFPLILSTFIEQNTFFSRDMFCLNHFSAKIHGVFCPRNGLGNEAHRDIAQCASAGTLINALLFSVIGRYLTNCGQKGFQLALSAGINSECVTPFCKPTLIKTSFSR